MKRDVHTPAQLYSLAETPQLPPSPRIWTRITRTLLVSQDRRHLFVTLCFLLDTYPQLICCNNKLKQAGTTPNLYIDIGAGGKKLEGDVDAALLAGDGEGGHPLLRWQSQT